MSSTIGDDMNREEYGKAYRYATIEEYMALAFKNEYSKNKSSTMERYIAIAEDLANKDNKTILKGLI
jgi:predicted ATP-dependent Lon-type protease